jgi:2-polyprenyl-6-methoxyphenol hydroxylase-like FAD-dependent oxidoreductase
MRVLVVGAGLGGLCLAHGLRRAGVDVRVLERRPGPEDQPAGYGIHLNADGLGALHSCLPAENWQQLVDATVPAKDVVRFLDERLDTLAVLDHETPAALADPVHRRRAVRRKALRDSLLSGLDTADVVQWGRAFSRYTVEPDGGIRVECTDGSVDRADLVVGADGSNSRVRAQRLPGLDRQDLGILNIAGRVPLTAGVRAALPELLVDGAVNNIVPRKPGWLFVSTWDAAGSPGADGLAVWAWVAQRGAYPLDVDTRPPVALRDLVAGRIGEWAPALRDLIARTDPATVGLVPLRTMPRLPIWPSSTVTLLGDAVHNMTPMAGIGANTALRDADELRRALLDPAVPDLDARVGHYEDRMRDYANRALGVSTRNARNAATSARLPRLAFRTLLRVAEAAPPAKRVLFRRPRRAAHDSQPRQQEA